jgi:hypothetical protein
MESESIHPDERQADQCKLLLLLLLLLLENKLMMHKIREPGFSHYQKRSHTANTMHTLETQKLTVRDEQSDLRYDRLHAPYNLKHVPVQ